MAGKTNTGHFIVMISKHSNFQTLDYSDFSQNS